MKRLFKKISAIASGVLLAGMTIGTAAAANYPLPFVSGSTADVAIVYGSGTGVDPSDNVQAGVIQEDLESSMTGTGGDTTVVGGDSVLLERSSDKVNLGDSVDDVFVVSITDSHMPSLLADGTYTDEANEEFDFTQKINLGDNINLTHFEDSDYKDDIPTIGIKIPSSTHVLNYTLDFTTAPDFRPDRLETTTFNIMGKEYYVLDVVNSSTTANTTTLLDSASSGIISEGETKTIQGKQCSISYISTSEVALTIDGEDTNSLNEGETQKLSDGTYIGIKDIRYTGKEGTISSVEISLGTGKLKITHGSEIELNDDTVSEIKGFLQTTTTPKLDKIVLEWSTDDEAFITEDSELLMPGFEAVKLSMGGMTYPAEEKTVVKSDSDNRIVIEAEIEDGKADIYILHSNSTGEFDAIGKDTDELLVTTNETTLTFNETNNDKWFVASWNASSEAESYLLSASVYTSDSINRTKIKNEVTNEYVCEDLTDEDTCSIGSVVLTVGHVYDIGSDEWVNFTITSGSFHELYTKEGLKIYLPYVAMEVLTAATEKGAITSNTSLAGGGAPTWNSTTGHGFGSFYLFFDEEDQYDALTKGTDFNFTLDEVDATSNKIHVSDIDTAQIEEEVDDTDNFESFVVSALATKVLYDTGGTQDSATVTYHGEQVYADVYITSPETTVSRDGGSLGSVVVKDSEVSSMSGKNLIVVGGSCINSVAANILGGSYCSAAFTEATGIGTGQFLIQSVESPYNSAKIALVVAGYETADTVAGTTYLTTQTVDTAVGTKLKGTSATSAELVTE